ncbi:MAG TPA: hypothetical protein VMU30_05430 [Bacteroidota bacterium]|nr:hypothetical protein [Bacteroidota bacterium]
MNEIVASSFAEGLVSQQPAVEYADKLMLYGQFVGDWVAETVEYPDDGDIKHSQWDIRFAWVLEGRAIQDLWITPVRNEKHIGWSEPGNRYSTTMRIYDPKIDAWHILWINPPGGIVVRQIGRKVGNDIVQVGEIDAKGFQSRWVYRDITPNSFRWCNERTIDQGITWKLMQEMKAKRV